MASVDLSDEEMAALNRAAELMLGYIPPDMERVNLRHAQLKLQVAQLNGSLNGLQARVGVLRDREARRNGEW